MFKFLRLTFIKLLLTSTHPRLLVLIGPHILKYCSDALCLPLHHLFCLCLHQCDLPLAWRLHCITPIYKSGDKSSIKNYRPISLLSCTSKVLEQIIYDKSIDFITNRFISRHQFGFLRNRSTSQQLLIFIYSILNSHRSHSSTDAFYLDLRKAFDTVSHPELLLKLSTAGITGDLWKWFHSYLTNRSQQVSVNGSLSYSLPVSSGVPQASILGPLLFLVYVNDLPMAITTSQLLMFADAAKCFSGIFSALDPITLQSDLNAITSWCTVNKLSLNEAKCVYLRFFPHLTSCEHSYTLNNRPIQSSNSHRDLGVILTSDLSFSSHIQKITSKAYKILGLVRRTFHCPSTTARLRLYTALIHSQLTVLSFGDPIY